MPPKKSCETVKHRCDSSYVTKGKRCIWHTKVSTLPSLPMFHFWLEAPIRDHSLLSTTEALEVYSGEWNLQFSASMSKPGGFSLYSYAYCFWTSWAFESFNAQSSPTTWGYYPFGISKLRIIATPNKSGTRPSVVDYQHTAAVAHLIIDTLQLRAFWTSAKVFRNHPGKVTGRKRDPIKSRIFGKNSSGWKTGVYIYTTKIEEWCERWSCPCPKRPGTQTRALWEQFVPPKTILKTTLIYFHHDVTIKISNSWLKKLRCYPQQHD